MTDAATPGGADGREQMYTASNAGQSYHIDDEAQNMEPEDVDDDISDYVKDWLSEEDDECNDGATVVIGRTQFFVGEMREYTG